MTKYKKIECYKCSGTGKIQAFSHVAAGDCFACKATGKLTINVEAAKAEIPADTLKKIEFILGATEEDYRTPYWNYKKLSEVDSFSCTASMNSAVRELYPQLRNHWCENGRQAFIDAQNERLRKWEEKNPV